ncbi:peptidase C14 caspase catalytic subunit p20 [Pseudodesulfovibrio mercurii]|uniref:Peptidase C14 caspase catalytic subunit p20 n=1 Tax=Pseudodesulfovibrio mercurii TaxID=641491 RepID=F0JJM0_9BACT|nr:caspase family protein [Pseudodesulfovibrio mercurii]EGB16119.1 peptidase C14 caspase catalytic subunit p20 [Pseudodesulfovibrio mercurii]
MNIHLPIIHRPRPVAGWLPALVPALFLLLTSVAFGAQKYALLIGINDYSHTGFRSLRGARNDIDLMRGVLVSRFGFAPGHIVQLVDGQATHTAIRDAFHRLRDTVGPGDFVYIHYSGHGSSVCDVSGDEGPGGLDSTWVAFGSRTGGKGKAGPVDCRLLRERAGTLPAWSDGIDSYDILDDELNGWLVELGRVTDNIVFVSDSCHSGTVTRSFEARATRGLPRDFRPYVPGRIETGTLRGVRIGACRDDEKAGEYRTGDKVYGMFTWFWANALMEVGPDATWQDLVKRASALIGYEYAGYSNQHPQIEGGLDREVFGGGGRDLDDRVSVAGVDDGLVSLNAGSLSGVTVNSLYVDTSRGGGAGERSVRIVSVEPTMSIGETSADLKPGDLLSLKRFWPEASSRSIFVRAELPGDALYAAMAREAVRNMPQFELAGDESSADLILHIFRPGRGAAKDAARQEGPPASDESAPVQCWILSPDGRPLAEGGRRLTLAVTRDWEKPLEDALERVSRVRHLLTLKSPPGAARPVIMEMTIWKPAVAGATGEIREIGGRRYARWGSFDTDVSDTAVLAVGDVLTFGMYNQSDTPYYCYLIDITDDGRILPFYPTEEKGMESGKVLPGQTLDTADDLSLEMDRSGREYIQLIVSRDPVDIGLLNQRRAGSSGKDLGFAGSFLLPASGRGKDVDRSVPPAQWATEKLVLDIAARGGSNS